jgi:hypothetical protein
VSRCRCWSLRHIERTTGVRRETISGYLKAAGAVVPGRGRRASRAKPAISTVSVSTDSGGANPAISDAVSPDPEQAKAATRAEVSTDSVPRQRPGRAPSASACEPYRELIAEALGRGRNAMAIWQDLVDDLLELIMRRYERASTLLTSNRPVDDWGKLLGDTAAVTALLDRLLHHAHVLKCGPRSWRTKVHADLQSGDSVR